MNIPLIMEIPYNYSFCGGYLYQHGMDLTLISQWLGHSQIETTLGYAYADTDNKRAAIARAMAEDPVLKNTSNRYQIEDEETIKRLYGLK